MTPRNINQLYQKLARSLPEAKSELIFNNHFELLIAVILSAQSTDKTVNKITPTLFSLCPTPAEFITLGQTKLAKIIKPIGLAATKSKNIITTCQILLDKHKGIVPSTRKLLEELPGVGRKTANVVLNEGFNQPTIAVDTHVFRVSNRTGLAPGQSVLTTELKLLEVTPKKWLLMAHHYLILHGRYICTAKNFNCQNCVINKECEYPDK
ncbi:MAG: endonuclease III [Nitrospinaceae bacterium]|nr:endonuclease III [Nitrospina sp.]MBT5867222.1 endonuclease III [Nitrospinaceae bacterium]MBT6346821.1 endonuclease III [Nitrospina sp.]